MWFCVIRTTLVRSTASSATIRFSKLNGYASKAYREMFSAIQVAKPESMDRDERGAARHASDGGCHPIERRSSLQHVPLEFRDRLNIVDDRMFGARAVGGRALGHSQLTV